MKPEVYCYSKFVFPNTYYSIQEWWRIRSILRGHGFELCLKERERGALFSFLFSSSILFVSRSIKIGRSSLTIFLLRLRFFLVAVRFVVRFFSLEYIFNLNPHSSTFVIFSCSLNFLGRSLIFLVRLEIILISVYCVFCYLIFYLIR